MLPSLQTLCIYRKTAILTIIQTIPNFCQLRQTSREPWKREGAGSHLGYIDVIVERMSAHAQEKNKCNEGETFVHLPIWAHKSYLHLKFRFF